MMMSRWIDLSPSLRIWACVLILPGVLWCERAAAQSEPTPPLQTACFELVARQPGTPPDAPMLINKCTGKTFVLVTRSRRSQAGKPSQYVWEPIPIADPVRDMAGSRSAGKKCFAYDKRLFCE
jgi:hypothetical protein